VEPPPPLLVTEYVQVSSEEQTENKHHKNVNRFFA